MVKAGSTSTRSCLLPWRGHLYIPGPQNAGCKLCTSLCRGLGACWCDFVFGVNSACTGGGEAWWRHSSRCPPAACLGEVLSAPHGGSGGLRVLPARNLCPLPVKEGKGHPKTPPFPRL